MTKQQKLILLLLCVSCNAFPQCYTSMRQFYSTIIARKPDGTLWGRGRNYYGTMGNGTTNPSGIFLQIGTSNNWSDSFCTGNTMSLGVQNDGTLWAWGDSNSIYGTVLPSVPLPPTQLGTDSNWSQVASGGTHFLAI